MDFMFLFKWHLILGFSKRRKNTSPAAAGRIDLFQFMEKPGLGQEPQDETSSEDRWSQPPKRSIFFAKKRVVEKNMFFGEKGEVCKIKARCNPSGSK